MSQLVIPQYQAPFQSQISPKELSDAGLTEISPLARAGAAVVGVGIITALAYHGYKRNRGSVGWAVAWGLGSVIWPIMVPVAVIQGYGKPAKKKR